MEKIKKSNSRVKLQLKESLSIQNALTLKEQFERAISEGDTIVIEHSDAEEFDLSYLQLLLSLDKYAAELGKKIKFTGSHPESFQQLVQSAGLSVDNWRCEPIDNSLKEDEGNE